MKGRIWENLEKTGNFNAMNLAKLGKNGENEKPYFCRAKSVYYPGPI
jgi:hypothetical protein